MKKMYSEPTTKFVVVNVSSNVMEQSITPSSDAPENTGTCTEEPLF